MLFRKVRNYFLVGEKRLDLDLVRAIAERDLRLLFRGRTFAYWLGLSLLIPVAVLIGLFWARVPMKQGTIAAAALGVQLVVIVAVRYGWNRTAAARAVQAGRIEELLVIGCHPSELCAGLLLVNLALMLSLILAGLPLAVLLVVISGGPVWRALFVVLMQAVYALLFLYTDPNLSEGNPLSSPGTNFLNPVLPMGFFRLSHQWLMCSLRGAGMGGFAFVVLPQEALRSAMMPGDWRWVFVALTIVLIRALTLPRAIRRAAWPSERAAPLPERVPRRDPWEARTRLRFDKGNPLVPLHCGNSQGGALLTAFVAPLLAPVILARVFMTPPPKYLIEWAAAGLLFFLLTLTDPLNASDRFGSEIENRQIEFLCLTRLSRWEIFWGKLWPYLVSARVLAVTTAIFLGIAVLIGARSLPWALCAATAMALGCFVLTGACMLAGARCPSASYAGTLTLGILLLPAALGFLGLACGVRWMAALSPFSALVSPNPACLPICVAVYGVLGLGVVIVAGRYLDRIVLYRA